MSKIISNVPADSLVRTERPPNKEILRYFIRHNALRAGTCENAPWVVEDELVKKYSLPSKFSDFLLDPHKVRIPKSACFAFPCIPWVLAETSVCCLDFRITKSLGLEKPPRIIKPNCYPVPPRPPLNDVPKCQCHIPVKSRKEQSRKTYSFKG